MNFLTISTVILVVTIGAIWSVLNSFSPVSESSSRFPQSQSTFSADSSVQDTVILDDLPPPDDTYTPDQRRYS